jgi:microcystin-dependent protein
MSFVNETKSTPIQNDTGANVRADINSNMAAIYSLNASSSEPSAANSVARMIWADETNDELKIRNGTNTSFITIGSLNETNLGLATKASPTFTGNVGVPAGTVSSLPIRRSDDTNTGIYFSAADTLDIATGGTRRAHFDTNGITIRDRKALRFRDTSNSNFVALRAPDNAASDITLTLPSSDGNANDVLQSDGSGNLSFAALPTAVPSGTVHLFATTTAPTGYLECDGSAISRTTYADLFTVIGTTWGAGDGSSTFNLPDLRGEFVRGWDNGRGVDSGRNFGTAQSDDNREHGHSVTQGPHNHQITDPGHFHNVAYSNSDSGDGVIEESGVGLSGFEPTETATTGISINTALIPISIDTDGSEARPRNIAMMYVIKT